ncbi:site-specific DNA-methyltransferase [Enteroscipio rubneri]|uniref:Site-specific DNA-methyltransferase n=1 Tax=Enteroscipio rubneri TaxID=2070686 RepID=A0A2K2UAA8_9ACTN|nr:site-specific DNA-methyltransferase [Enteroscipio rubneri]PNV67148.1 site-specific DNA-methyltransferase [Enteroscipio rubneri]
MTKQRLELTWYNKDMTLIPTETGKYGYTWVAPSDPRYCETHTLVFDKYIQGAQTPKSDEIEYSSRADLQPQSDNLMILGESGDVLETLTRVPELAAKYYGAVKLVYIDPPFNTSQTFESYEDNLEHSIWLTMMRDRLLHLKQLLAPNGSIWVHLDDVEVHRMRLLMDEAFGAHNFVAEICWEKTFKPRNDAKAVSGRHDVLLLYRKSEQNVLNKLPRTVAMDSAYKNPDNDPMGPWTSAPATAPGAKTHQGMVFGVQHPITGELIYPPIGQCWRFGQDRFLDILRGWNESYVLREIEDAEKRAEICNVSTSEVRKQVPAIVIPGFSSATGEHVYRRGQWPLAYLTGGGKGGFRKKTYLCDMEQRAIEDLWFQAEVGSNDEAKNEIKMLFPGETPFSTPKPERLLERIIHIATDPGDIVLDCFAGSGTTAAVAQKMGRRWVTCELLAATFKQFTLPRLEKVVNDQDPSGISRTKGGRVVTDGVELPEGVTADDAMQFSTLLNKLIADNDELKKDKVIATLKALVKTRRAKETVNWRGGGGFQVAHLSPSCFDYDAELGRVLLTPAAAGDMLKRSVAANLGFRLLDPDDEADEDTFAALCFHGRRGNAFLYVYEGVASVGLVNWLVSRIRPSQTIVLAVTSVADGVREHLRRSCKGSRIVVIPDDIFPCLTGGDE